MQPDISIIRQFTGNLGRECTIRQISKLIEKSYAFTNNHVRKLIDSRVLNKKVVGNAILCSLNLSNEKVIGLLINASIEKREEFLAGNEGLAAKVKEIIDLAWEEISSIIIVDEKISLLCDDELKHDIVLEKLNKFNVNVLNNADFISLVKENLAKVVCVYGYEKMWRLVK